MGVCQSAQEKYDDVFATCKKWQAQYANNPELAEVLSLQGDAFAATGKEDEAIDSYLRSYKIAKNPDTQRYSLFDGAGKLLEKKADWEQVSTLFEDFAKGNPDSPYIITAFYQIGRARVHQDKADEAKTFLAGSIKKYMDDPARDDVEKILKLLVQLCARRPPPPLPPRRRRMPPPPRLRATWPPLPPLCRHRLRRRRRPPSRWSIPMSS